MYSITTYSKMDRNIIGREFTGIGMSVTAVDDETLSFSADDLRCVDGWMYVISNDKMFVRVSLKLIKSYEQW